MSIDTTVVESFKELFKANTHTYYVYRDKKHKHATGCVLNTYQYSDHLNKKYSLVVVPTTDDGLSYFGVIDYDNHDGVVDLNLLESKIKKQSLPLVVCRSKSGSGHAYLFLSEPVPSSELRETLFKLSTDIRDVGEKQVELFPKQDKVDFINTGSKGSGIHIPYALDTTYAIAGGKALSVEEFITEANKKKVSKKALSILRTGNDAEAPPCIQVLLRLKSTEGSRNTTLFSYGVYAKKAYPSDWRTKVQDFNNNNFETPLTYEEVDNLIKALNKNDYKYKCQEEPLKGLCDSQTCVTRKYGIDGESKKELELAELPEFTSLTKYMTDPIKWVLAYEKVTVMVTTEELLDFKQVRKRIFEKSNILVTQMKNDKWNLILDKLSKSVIEIKAPDDAEKGGLIRSYYNQYIVGAKDIRYEHDKINKRTAYLNNRKPIIDEIKGDVYLLFQGVHFKKFLEGKKCYEKQADVFIALVGKGVIEKTITTIDKGVSKSIRCWGQYLGDSKYVEDKTMNSLKSIITVETDY